MLASRWRNEEICPQSCPRPFPRLAQQGIQESVQHDDLHMRNLYSAGGKLRVVDWGDSSIAHPFFSLLVMFRFLEEFNHLAPNDTWFRRLRDAYLEPWGSGLEEA